MSYWHSFFVRLILALKLLNFRGCNHLKTYILLLLASGDTYVA
jgi:hypothetical protein